MRRAILILAVLAGCGVAVVLSGGLSAGSGWDELSGRGEAAQAVLAELDRGAPGAGQK